jgi:predicted nucleic acid-binding protein
VAQYVDSSVLLKRYIAEPETREARRLLAADATWVCGAHTIVEVRRTLSVRLAGEDEAMRRARAAFDHDWARIVVAQLDEVTCRSAADLAELTAARSLDALHLACAQRAGAPALRFVTFDTRLATAARSLGWQVAGA